MQEPGAQERRVDTTTGARGEQIGAETPGVDAGPKLSSRGPIPTTGPAAPSGPAAASSASELAFGAPGTAAAAAPGAPPAGSNGAPTSSAAAPKNTAETSPTPTHLRVKVAGLNVRSSTTTDAENIVGGLHLGDEVDSLGREGDWVRVSFRGVPAFVHGDFVEPATKTTADGTHISPAAIEDGAKTAAAIARPPAAASGAPVGAAIASASPTASAAPTAATPQEAMLHAEIDAILRDVHAGLLHADDAMRRFVVFDIAHNNGIPSPTGIGLMAELARDVIAHAAVPAPAHLGIPTAPTATPATPTAAAPAAVAPVAHAVATGDKPPEGSATPNTAHHEPAATPYTGEMDDRGGKKLDDAYMAKYHHLAGGQDLSIEPTKDTEAHALNHIRDDARKLDPVTLRTVQESLGVKNATGAMNTETLRVLKTTYKKAFSVEALLSGKLLGAQLTIIKAGGNGFGPDGTGAALRESTELAAGETKADAMAQVAGFADYNEMHGSFTDLVLFGKKIGSGLPFLAQRLQLADTYLRQRTGMEGVTDKKKLQAVAQSKLNWNYTGQGAYGDTAESIAKASDGRHGAHFHSNGLALDIDPSENPYVFSAGAMTVKTKAGVEESIDGHIARNFRYAAQIFGGEEITPHKMMQWSADLSSEELAAKVDMASASVTKYIHMCQTETDDQIELKFRNAGYDATTAKANVEEAKHFAKTQEGKSRYWQDNMSRKNMEGLTTHSMEMIVALRDVAGLAWGGTEMSEGQNGDFMHYDCRNTAVGQKLFRFAQHNRGAEPAAAPAAKQGAGTQRPPGHQ